jgi:hypothetical protein
VKKPECKNEFSTGDIVEFKDKERYGDYLFVISSVEYDEFHGIYYLMSPIEEPEAKTSTVAAGEDIVLNKTLKQFNAKDNIPDKLDKILENQERIIALLEYGSSTRTREPELDETLFVPFNGEFLAYQTTGNFRIETGIQHSGEPLSRYGVDYLY